MRVCFINCGWADLCILNVGQPVVLQDVAPAVKGIEMQCKKDLKLKKALPSWM